MKIDLTSFSRIEVGHKVLAAVALLLLCQAQAGEPEPLATDRPDFVEASTTVGKGVFQFETGLGFERSKVPGPDENIRLTPILLRYGMLEDWELRLESEGAVRYELGDVRESGLADISIGAKWHSIDAGEGWRRPSMAWLFHVDLETGSDELKGDGLRPSVRAVAEWDLWERTALGAMAGVKYDSNEDGDHYLGGIFGLVLGYSFMDIFRGFVEYAAPNLASCDDGGNVATWGAGVSYLLSENWQVDGAFSINANGNSPDTFWTVGLSGRFGR
jgi:hypothetical protein